MDGFERGLWGEGELFANLGGLQVGVIGEHDHIGDGIASEESLSDIADVFDLFGVLHIDEEEEAGEIDADLFKDGIDGSVGDSAIDDEEGVLTQGDASVFSACEVGDLHGGFAGDACGLGL